jgi:predicted restriction endonuclease
MSIRLIRHMSSRPEQRKLRKFLLDNKEHKCIICQKDHPTYLLECAHIKPRCMSNEVERYDFNIVNWMCRNCHKIYDKGDIGINEGLLIKSDFIKDFDFDDNFRNEEFIRSSKYFDYHFKNIYFKIN